LGVNCDNHTGAILILAEVFEVSNQSLLHAKQERIDKQYSVDVSVTESDTRELLTEAELGIAELDLLAQTLTTSERNQIRDKFETLF
jgi:hypothetical protein